MLYTPIIEFRVVCALSETIDTFWFNSLLINVDKVYSQAKKYKHSVKREYLFLVVHGLLHLCGYDHVKSKKEEKIMFALQDEIVGDLKWRVDL